MIGDLHFQIGVQGQMGKWCYPQPLTAVSQRLLEHPVISGTLFMLLGRKRGQCPFAGTSVIPKTYSATAGTDTIRARAHENYAAEALKYLLGPHWPCLSPSRSTPCHWGCWIVCCHALHGTSLPGWDFKSLDFCCLRNHQKQGDLASFLLFSNISSVLALEEPNQKPAGKGIGEMEFIGF